MTTPRICATCMWVGQLPDLDPCALCMVSPKATGWSPQSRCASLLPPFDDLQEEESRP